MKQAGGEILAVEKWDKRRLAYEVAGKREGLYILMYFRGEPAVATELDRVMKISEDVMRHLIVRDDLNQAAAAQERALRPVPAEQPEAVEAAPKDTPAEAPAEAPEAPAAEAEPAAEPAAEENPEPAEVVETAEAAEPAEEQAPAEETPAEQVE